MDCFLVDRSDVVRASLKRYTSDIKKLNIVGEAADVEEAIIQINSNVPDVIITDIESSDSIKLIKVAKSLTPKPIVVVFMDSQYPQYKDVCLKAGADHFFKKPEEIEVLYSFLLNVAENIT